MRGRQGERNGFPDPSRRVSASAEDLDFRGIDDRKRALPRPANLRSYREYLVERSAPESLEVERHVEEARSLELLDELQANGFADQPREVAGRHFDPRDPI